MKDIYILSNLVNNTTEINLPLKHTQRVKYTCFDASKKYLIFGASSGSLYIFQRKPCKFLQLIPTKYRSITNIAISPNERFVAFTTQKGMICVLVINISANSIPQVITTNIGKNDNGSAGGGVAGGGIDIKNGIDESLSLSSSSSTSSKTNTVSCIHWSSDEKQFYYGNSKGDVYLVTLTFFVGKTLLDITIHPILFLDSSIVQISEFESLLLVSNLMKCILCNMDYEEYKQIGNQPRDGYYGACFSIIEQNDYTASRIFCARPGCRIWEVNLEGNVIKTHEFKTALQCSSTKIIDDILLNEITAKTSNKENDNNDVNTINTDINYIDGSNNDNINYTTSSSQSSFTTSSNVQFSKLQTINNSNFILTFTENALYILDPREPCVILWCDKFNGIIDCIVVDNEIIIFTNLGHLYTIRLQTLQSYAIDLIQNQQLQQQNNNKINLCIKLLRKNLKYFAEKSKENYDLLILNEIKTYLIKTNQYELLNDLSVIFDCLTLQQKDNNPNLNLNTINNIIRQPITLNNYHNNQYQYQQKQSQSHHHHHHHKKISNGVYVLENAFCDNLKNKSSSIAIATTTTTTTSSSSTTTTTTASDKLIKDMLLTVTGKFGKNIIKYKFNIFNEEQKSLVEDLIPIEKNIPFQEIYEQYDNENDDIICNHAIVKKNHSSLEEQTITEEERTVYDLYFIWKSSKISNICFLDRYRSVFDRYTSKEIINLLSKLEKIMIENGDKIIDAKINCYEMYFNYLKPELLWELDDDTRDYIKNGFISLNNNNNNNQRQQNEIDDNMIMINCDNCKFPIQFSRKCVFRNIGEILFKFYQSRNEQKLCLDLIKNVPSLIDILCKYLIQNNYNHNDQYTLRKILILIFNYGDNKLFEEITNYYCSNCNNDDNDILKLWNECFELFANIQNYKFLCPQCNKCIFINDNNSNNYKNLIEKNPFYTWNCFLNIALNYLNGEEILSFILKYSNLMTNNCIEKEIFIRCLLKD